MVGMSTEAATVNIRELNDLVRDALDGAEDDPRLLAAHVCTRIRDKDLRDVVELLIPAHIRRIAQQYRARALADVTNPAPPSNATAPTARESRYRAKRVGTVYAKWLQQRECWGYDEDSKRGKWARVGDLTVEMLDGVIAIRLRNARSNIAISQQMQRLRDALVDAADAVTVSDLSQEQVMEALRW